MADKSRELYKLRKKLEELGEIRGRNTELVTLYIPDGYNINKALTQMKQERETAQNIKSKSTRKNVQAALDKIVQYLKGTKTTPENGLVLFCGDISDNPSKRNIELYDIIPPRPIDMKHYKCDKDFFIEPLKDMAYHENTYGLMIIEKNEATIGTLRGKRIVKEDQLTSNVPGKTKAGGQSQQRYRRIREEMTHNFLIEIGEHADRIFKEMELNGIIIGGPGGTKDQFIDGDFLHHELQTEIIGNVNVSYNGEYGLKEMVRKASDILKDQEVTKERELMEKFLKKLVDEPRHVTYGVKEVKRSIRLGAVKTLLISEEFDHYEVQVDCNDCGFDGSEYVEGYKVKNKDKFNCPECGSSNVEIEKKELMEVLMDDADDIGSEVEMISTDTDQGVQLRDSFNGIGAILRYPIN